MQPNVSRAVHSVQPIRYLPDNSRGDAALARRWGCSISKAEKIRRAIAQYSRDVIDAFEHQPHYQEQFIEEVSQSMAGVDARAEERDLRRLELSADTAEDQAEGEYYQNPCPESRDKYRRALSRQGGNSLALARKIGQELS